MGPSGCGKSTLLAILGMLDSPSSGSYCFDGQDISHFSEQQLANLRKASVGFVFQSFNLIDELTVFENVELPLQYLQIGAASAKAGCWRCCNGLALIIAQSLATTTVGGPATTGRSGTGAGD